MDEKEPKKTAEAAPEAGAAAPAPAEGAKQSARDGFRSRVSQRYPELNMEDEDAYYGQMNSLMDENEEFENNSRRMRESMGKSPLMVEMLYAARNQENFDPLVYFVEQGLDLDALRDDPEYAKAIGEARAKYLETQSKRKEIEQAVETNMPSSMEAVNAKAAELGLSEEDTKAVLASMYEDMENLIKGIVDPEKFALCAKGRTHDADVESAREEGVASGLNTAVTDKLRDVSGKKPNMAGSQRPAQPKKPKEQPKNMFLA